MQQNPNGYGPPPGYPPQGYPPPGYQPQPPPKKGIGVLGWIGITSLILFGGCFGMCAVASKGVADKGASEKKAYEAEPAVRVTADELIAAYQANEISADSEYKGKKLRVTGALASIDSGMNDEPILHIGSKVFPTVSARGVSKSSAVALTKGAQITVECKGDGEIGGMPMLSGCELK